MEVPEVSGKDMRRLQNALKYLFAFVQIPCRSRSEKWFIPWSEYGEEVFPDYVAGMSLNRV